MAPIFAIIRYALLETFFCIPILPKTGFPLGLESFFFLLLSCSCPIRKIEFAEPSSQVFIFIYWHFITVPFLYHKRVQKSKPV